MFIIHSKYNQPQNTLTVNPLSRPRPEGLFISSTFEEGGGGGGGFERDGLLYLAKMMVSIFSIKIRIQSGNAQVHEQGGHAAKDPKQIPTFIT